MESVTDYQAVCPQCSRGIAIQAVDAEPGWGCVCMLCGGVSVVDQALQRKDEPIGDLFLRRATEAECAWAMRTPWLRDARDRALGEQAKGAAGA